MRKNWFVHLIEAAAGFFIGFRGLRYVWRYFPTFSDPMAWPWLSHVWMALIPALWCIVFRTRMPWTNQLRGWILPGIFTMVVSIGALFVMHFTPLRASIDQVFPHDPPMLLFEAIAPGLGEEVLFRGFLQTQLNCAFPWKLSLASVQIGTGTLLASLAFGAAHLSNGMPLPILLAVAGVASLIGLGLGAGYERTGNLWMSIVLHNVADLVNCGIVAVFP